ncbi:hypothetical protein TNCT_554121 [Trichonephila clavata]|uniref:Uncharacterized protein n=1 Tax=Trichonephila clavata TaxID=2740835 RepID=A0A8X6HST7_TRICU|nr:hypothetical protein TNCT_554121 [Trichonephila clavata]
MVSHLVWLLPYEDLSGMEDPIGRKTTAGIAPRVDRDSSPSNTSRKIYSLSVFSNYAHYTALSIMAEEVAILKD